MPFIEVELTDGTFVRPHLAPDLTLEGNTTKLLFRNFLDELKDDAVLSRIVECRKDYAFFIKVFLNKQQLFKGTFVVEEYKEFPAVYAPHKSIMMFSLLLVHQPKKAVDQDDSPILTLES